MYVTGTKEDHLEFNFQCSLIITHVVKCCIVAPTTMRLSKRDERLLERCLQLIYSGKKSSYETLSEKDGSVSILHKSFRL